MRLCRWFVGITMSITVEKILRRAIGSTLQGECTTRRNSFGWQPRRSVREALEKTIEWTKIYREKGRLADSMAAQVEEYMNEVI